MRIAQQAAQQARSTGLVSGRVQKPQQPACSKRSSPLAAEADDTAPQPSPTGAQRRARGVRAP
eukprot:1079092-Prymnesium_polylepis.1